MIKANLEDIERIKKIIPKNHLILATSNYRGFWNLLGFLSQLVNLIQQFTRPKYNNNNIYIAHVFCIFYKNDCLWVGEMDQKKGWIENPIKKCNTFLKLKTGQIRIFNLGEFEDEEFLKMLEYARNQRYSLIEAISSKKLFRFLRVFISDKNRYQSNKSHCGSVFVKYKSFHKFFKRTGKSLFREYKTHHPESIDFHMCQILKIKPIIIKTKKEKLQWKP